VDRAFGLGDLRKRSLIVAAIRDLQTFCKRQAVVRPDEGGP
jgi:hypothetical protein